MIQTHRYVTLATLTRVFSQPIQKKPPPISTPPQSTVQLITGLITDEAAAEAILDHV